MSYGIRDAYRGKVITVIESLVIYKYYRVSSSIVFHLVGDGQLRNRFVGKPRYCRFAVFTKRIREIADCNVIGIPANAACKEQERQEKSVCFHFIFSFC